MNMIAFYYTVFQEGKKKYYWLNDTTHWSQATASKICTRQIKIVIIIIIINTF